MIGVKPQAVNNWIYRDHIPQRGIEAIIARFPQVDREWLRGGSLPTSSGPLPLPEEDEDDEMSAPLATVGQPASNETPQTENREGLIPIQMPRRDVKYIFLCHGDSMLPRIQDGDYIGVGDAIGRYENFQSGVPYLIQTTDGRFMVKAVTYGSFEWLDFAKLWNTGYARKGGLVLLQDSVSYNQHTYE